MVIKGYTASEAHSGAQIGDSDELSITCENCGKVDTFHPFAVPVPVLAIRSDGSHEVKEMGLVSSFDEAAELVEKMEEAGSWPEAYDAVLKPGDGTEHMFSDWWEETSKVLVSYALQQHDWTEPERLCCSKECCIQLAAKEGIVIDGE